MTNAVISVLTKKCSLILTNVKINTIVRSVPKVLTNLKMQRTTWRKNASTLTVVVIDVTLTILKGRSTVALKLLKR